MKIEVSLNKNIIVFKLCIKEIEILGTLYNSLTILSIFKFCLFHVQKMGKFIWMTILNVDFKNTKRLIRKYR
jgi:hypothetical protein